MSQSIAVTVKLFAVYQEAFDEGFQFQSNESKLLLTQKC